jgi:hypothetical protein
LEVLKRKLGTDVGFIVTCNQQINVKSFLCQTVVFLLNISPAFCNSHLLQKLPLLLKVILRLDNLRDKIISRVFRFLLPII